jgi:hypothetical protein
LAARIWELRDSGVPITTTVVTTRSGKRIAVYRLGEPNVRRFKCR